MTAKAVTVRLQAEDYRRLESEARRLGMRPGTLARVLLRSGLTGGAIERPAGDGGLITWLKGDSLDWDAVERADSWTD